MEKVLEDFGAHCDCVVSYYTLVMNMTDNKEYCYGNAYKVCGAAFLKTMEDVEEYIQKATEYIANEYNIDLEYDIDENGKIQIFFTDSNDILIEGYYTSCSYPSIYTFKTEEE